MRDGVGGHLQGCGDASDRLVGRSRLPPLKAGEVTAVAPDPIAPEGDGPSAVDEAATPAPPRSNPALGDADRERLNAVLRDLLDCKRLLERARE